MAILLIRHGETPGNRDRIIQFPETPLSERGLEQAARLGARLAREPIGEIWVSDHARARMTAEAVERASGAPLRVVEALAERNLGALRGTPYAELDFDPHAPDYAPPEGETWPDFHARVDGVWAEIEAHWLAHFAAREELAHLVVVTHGLVLRSLFERRLIDDEVRAQHDLDRHPLALANTAVSIIEPEVVDGRLKRHRVPLLACVAHLDAETAPRVNPNVGM